MQRFNETRPHFWDQSFEYVSGHTWNLWTAQKNAETIHATELLLRERDVSEAAIQTTLDALADNLMDHSVWQTEDHSFDSASRWTQDRLHQLRASGARAALRGASLT